MHGDKKTILVVDDEEMIVELYQEVLEGCGYNILTASSGNKAVKLLNENISLIISDVRMPDGDGLLLLNYTRKHFPNIPFYFITGYSGYHNEELKAAHKIIYKPISMEHLINIVSAQLGNLK